MNTLLALDERLTLALFNWGSAHTAVQTLFLAIAVVAVYALPVVLIWLFWRNQAADRRTVAKIFIAVVISWRIFSQALGAFLYGQYGFRDRPFALEGLREFFFERPEKAFPSDHAVVLTVVVLLLFRFGYPKLGGWFIIALLLTALGRVVVGFHFLGDVLGGVGLGLVTYALMLALDRPLERLFDRLNFSRQ